MSASAGTSSDHPIVVGVDGSESSIAALKWAIRQAELTGSTVKALATWSWPTAAALGGGLPEDFNPEQDTRGALDEAVASAAGAQPQVRIETEVVEGSAGQILVAASSQASLLVIGTRGHGQLAGILIGSVSEYCIAHAECPVVVLRHPHG